MRDDHSRQRSLEKMSTVLGNKLKYFTEDDQNVLINFVNHVYSFSHNKLFTTMKWQRKYKIKVMLPKLCYQNITRLIISLNNSVKMLNIFTYPLKIRSQVHKLHEIL